MTYQETLAYLFGLARFGMKPGLERISLLLRNLGNPEERIQIVHVAGTNGKGSTAAFLAAITAAGGYRTGLFTSPHLISFTERMRINGSEIAEDRVVRLAGRVIEVAPPATTFFEIVTAMAFLYFAEEGVDLAIMEAGMGGRLDSTNSASGIVSIITPISLDHCQYLGESIAEIACEKAGVIKPGRPVVVSGQTAAGQAVITRCCANAGSPVYLAGSDFNASWRADGLSYRGLRVRLSGLLPGLAGRYQAGNAAAALCAAELLAASGFDLGPPSLRRGIAAARWPGRMEFIGTAPRFLLDGAHNAAGAAALAEALADVPRVRLLMVAGMMNDKDAEGILAPLLPFADRVYAVAPAVERALPSSELASFCRDRGVEVVDAGGVDTGLSLAGEAAAPQDLVLVCGSLYTVGEARALLFERHFEPFRG